MKVLGYILLLSFPVLGLAQQSIHLRGQNYLELNWQRNLEHSPGLAFAISAGRYLDGSSAFKLGIGKVFFYTFEKELFWQEDPMQDSILFNRLLSKPYTAFFLFASYQRLILKQKDRMFLNGFMGAELGRERFGDKERGTIYGLFLGVEVLLYLKPPLAFLTSYSFHYQASSHFPLKSRLGLGVRLSVNPD